jgi:hypothetical protein
MARPRVNIQLMNGQLGLQGPQAFGTCGLLVATPLAPVAGYGVPFLCKSKKAVQDAFAQPGNVAVKDAIVQRFFAEAAEGTSLYIMAMAQATSLTTLLAPANADKLLTLANGAIRLLGVVKYPDTGTYAPVITGGFDNDVHTAIIAAQVLADAWFAQKKPFRVLIEGYGFTTAGAASSYETNNKRNVACVVFSIGGSTASALLQVLGKASASTPNQNIGRIKNGSLVIPETDTVRIGAILMENVSSADLELLHDKRYISVERNEIAAGVVVTDDNMATATTDDYSSLANGRVIDNATRVAFATYYRELKDDVEVDGDGRLAPVVEKALENAIESKIDELMRGQLSTKNDGTADVECLVNPDAVQYAPLYAANNLSNPNFNILQTGNVYLFLQLRPKGSLRYLNVFLGFTA